MFGAICGDVLGAPYEISPVTFKDFILLADNGSITDDTVCTCAVAKAILSESFAFGDELKRWAKSFDVQYGERFQDWIHSDHVVNDSAGNGCVSRVASIPWLAPDLRTALDWAAMSAMTSHRHPDSVKAAIATVAAARLGMEGYGKSEAMGAVSRAFGYRLDVPLAEIRPGYGFRLLAVETVPVALRAVLEGDDFEDVLRLAISMGGDADTLAAVAGGVAEVFHPIPEEIRSHVWERLPGPVRMMVLDVGERKEKLLRMGVAPLTPKEDAHRILEEAHSHWLRQVRRPPPSARWQMRFSYWVRESMGLV